MTIKEREYMHKTTFRMMSHMPQDKHTMILKQKFFASISYYQQFYGTFPLSIQGQKQLINIG